MRFVYVFDAYCGWSYGFAPTLAEIVRRHPELDVEVVSGGLFTGPRRCRSGSSAMSRAPTPRSPS